MYKRLLNLPELLKKKSLLLLGPRQTGKSTIANSFAEQQFGERATYYNLSETDTYRELSARPELIRQRLDSETQLLIIDEAQRLPDIFNEVQVLLDRNKSLRVLLTGSSARKLRRNEMNLLPGRIWRRNLFPLVSAELGEARIDQRICRGSLPGILDNENFREELKNYVGLYLEEEIRAEGLTRNVGNFSRFLEVAALCNAEQLNYSNVANETGIKLNTVKAYYQILYDTLIAYELESFRRTKTRKAVAAPKFYFFDLGVVNELLGRFEIKRHSDLFGKSLEHLIFTEIKAAIDYQDTGTPLNYWRSHSQFEVDFLLGERVAIEVKSSANIHSRDEKALLALAEDLKLRRKLIVCLEKKRRTSDGGTEIVPVEEFLEELWSGELFE